jgi:hypothetical protein
VIWSEHELRWLGIETASEGDAITLSLGTPAGDLQIMAEVAFEDRTLLLRGAHIQGAKPNMVGIANLRLIAELVLERSDCD